jgi:hypothetical protein
MSPPPKHEGGQQTTHIYIFVWYIHSIIHTYNPEGCAPQNVGKSRTRQRGMGVVSTRVVAEYEYQHIGSHG